MKDSILTPIMDALRTKRIGIRFQWRPQLCKRSVRQGTLLAHRADTAKPPRK